MCVREQAVELGVELLASSSEGLHVGVVGRGEAAADVEDLDLGVAAVPGLLEDAGGQVQGLHVVVEVGALAAHVEAQALDHQAGVEGRLDQVHGLARRGAELGRQLDHRARCWAP